MNLVSIIITSYCGSKNVRRSIVSAINQTYSNIEIIVVDDNDPTSEERRKTEEILGSIKDDRVKYIKHEKNLNGSAARNTGISIAKGDYIQLLDDDDYLFPEKIEMSVQALNKYPECDMVITGVIAYGTSGISDLSGAFEESNNCIISKEWLFRFNALGTGSNIFATKTSILHINGFDDSYPRMQDIEFIFRYCQKFKVCSIPERLIIKDLNDRPIKIGTYNKQSFVINKFIGQFNKEIDRLIGSKSKIWYEEQYSHLFRVALMNGTKEEISEARHNLESYRSLSFVEKLKMHFPSIWRFIRENKILRKYVMKRREGSKVIEKFEEQLSDYEKESVYEYVSEFSAIQY